MVALEIPNPIFVSKPDGGMTNWARRHRLRGIGKASNLADEVEAQFKTSRRENPQSQPHYAVLSF